ncbi:sensor histidine kinase, partial [Klebsiella pneumoniae]|uniref:sensor histidine kinase n=1 Tax=Klebsiella pneumoniae TaxID=573 RepID=UPI000BD82A6F
HELRTPLASLRGYIELISYKEGQHISEEANKYLKQALKSSNELGGLINNLLDVTRIERGTLTLNMERMDLAATIA